MAKLKKSTDKAASAKASLKDARLRFPVDWSPYPFQIPLWQVSV